MVPVKNMFFEFESDEGQMKSRLLVPPSKIISPVWGHRPRFRLSWEYIQDDIAQSKARIVERMRSAKESPELGDEYEKIQGECPTSAFFTLFNRYVLPQVYSDYKTGNGIDADIFLEPRDVQSPPVFHIELFPRKEIGIMVKSFGSRIRYEVPLAAPMNERWEETLQSLIYLDIGGRGMQWEEAERLWNQHKGLWPITEPRTVSLFLHKASFSHIEHFCPESKSMVLGGTAIDWATGEEARAILKFTRSK